MGDVKGHERHRPEGHPVSAPHPSPRAGSGRLRVEPGIYFIDSLLAAAHENEKRAFIEWSVVDELKPYGGIRIEDNVVATASNRKT